MQYNIKRLITTGWVIIPFVCYLNTCFATTTPTLNPTPPKINAHAYLLMDYHSNRILASSQDNEKLAPASLTKMMTMYVIDSEIAKGKLKLTDLVKVSKKAWQATGSRMFIEVNKEIPVSELIKGIIISSGNDASIAMAEHIAGSEEGFAQLMNYYAQKLGMKETHFVNSTGLPDPNHYTTGADLAILARALIEDFPNSYKLYSEKNFTYNNIKQTNRNLLLGQNEAIDGIKTGHTDSAGYCLVASGKKEQMRLISVLLGAKTDHSRMKESNMLMNWGFRFFDTHKLYEPAQPIKEVRLWMGKEKTLSLGTTDPVYVTVSEGEFKQIQTTVEIPNVIKAPTQAGETIGKLTVKLHDTVLLEKPIVSLKTIEKSNLFHRFYDYIALKINSLSRKITDFSTT